MTSFLSDVIRPAVVAAMAIMAAHCNAGCAPIPLEARSATERAYVAELMGCVERAKTKEESKTCRRNVNIRYGVCDRPWPEMTPCDE
jgi:hypothetical protein